MQKIDFDDFYKFLVSVGLIIIGLSLLIPYAFLKDDFNLLIELDKYSLYAKEVQNIILLKQKYVLFGLKIFPFFCVFLFIIGVIILSYGICKWWSRQKSVDTKNDLEINKLQLEVKALSKEEIVEKVKNEIENEKYDPFEIRKDKIHHINNKTINEYLLIENEIIEFFRKDLTISSDFNIYDNLRISSNIDIDVLLKSKIKNLKDVIIEIKYFKNIFSKNNISRSILMINNITNFYKHNIKRDVKAFLILVYSNETINFKELDKVKEKLEDIKNTKNVIVKIIERREIQELDINSDIY